MACRNEHWHIRFGHDDPRVLECSLYVLASQIRTANRQRGFAGAWGSKALKRQITYRRAGHVKYRPARLKAGVAATSATVIGALIACGVYALNLVHQQNPFVLFAGLATAVLYAYATGLSRAWRCVAAVVIAIGPLALHSLLPNLRHMDALSMNVIAATWLASCVITFWSYLRQTHPADVEAEYEAK
jgi:hypothetical protein